MKVKIGLSIFCILVFPFVAGLVLAMLATFICLLMLRWVLGSKIVITRNNVKVGYVRWFSFYVTENPCLSRV